MRRLLLIIAITTGVYLPFVGHEYINIDDYSLITGNQAVISFDVPRVFTSYDPELYIPLTLFSYQVEHLLFGFIPIVTHTINLALHVCTALLVYAVITRLTRNKNIGLLTALLFAIHPVHSTTVLWASARKDLLSSCFMMLALLLYLKGNKKSLWVYLAALLSKVTVAVFPLLLLLVDYWEGKSMHKERIKEHWQYFALSFMFGLIAVFGKTGNVSSLHLVDTLLLSAKNISFSLWKLMVPTQLSFTYFQVADISLLQFLVPLAAIVLLGIAMFVGRKQLPIGSWCFAWFFLFMAPNLFTYFQNGQVVFASNRYMYLPSIGIALFVASELVRLKKIGFLLGGLIVAILGALTVNEAMFWRNSETILKRALATGHDVPMVHHNLGAALNEQGDTDGALQEFQIAAQAGYPYAYTMAGDIFLSQGKNTEALTMYENGMRAARRRGVYGTVDLANHFKIASTLMKQGRLPQAKNIFEESIRLGPHVASAHTNLALLNLQQGNVRDAKAELETAVTLDRFSSAAWFHLAYIYAQEGNRQQAIRALKKTLRIDPEYPGAIENLEKLL